MILNFFQTDILYFHKDYPEYFLIPIFAEDDYKCGYRYRDCWIIDLNAKTHPEHPNPLLRVDILTLIPLDQPAPTVIQYFIKKVQLV